MPRLWAAISRVVGRIPGGAFTRLRAGDPVNSVFIAALVDNHGGLACVDNEGGGLARRELQSGNGPFAWSERSVQPLERVGAPLGELILYEE